MTKNILGLDLGTNSIGWALIKKDDENTSGNIQALGSRIIPMSQEIIGEFDRGNSVSQTAARTGYRGVRRLRERHLLRRERLHKVLNNLGFLPIHFSLALDNHGHFIDGREVKLPYFINNDNKFEFAFVSSYNEMLADFEKNQPSIISNQKKVPYDWTLYYLRKKALSQKIEKAELAWLLLNFNQKRGYYQLRGEDDEKTENKIEEFYNLNVIDVTVANKGNRPDETWYNVVLDNGWIYRRSSKIPLFDWVNKRRDFIVTTEINEDGTIKTDKEGKEKRTFRAPKDDDWGLLKKKTETDIYNSNKTVGSFIYEALLKNPNQKIKGKLVRTIERNFYKDELSKILDFQIPLHDELNDSNMYNDCIKLLYKSNDSYRESISKNGFKYLFLDDIIFYQRPLKSKKSEIADCPLEYRSYINENKQRVRTTLKCISRSHPLFQEFRIWQWLQNLRIYELEKNINGKLQTDVDVTSEFLTSEEDYVKLYDFLTLRKDISQTILLKFILEPLKLKGKALTSKIEKYRWNYVVDKDYPCNETKNHISNRLSKVKNVPENFLTTENEIQLWHILYSVRDKFEIQKALSSYAAKFNLDVETFVENFKKYPLIKSEYGSFSEKAIKKLLALMRMGKYWNIDSIDSGSRKRIDKIITGEFDSSIKDRVREKAITLIEISSFRGLPLWLASYVIYDRHSEAGENKTWKIPEELQHYLDEFKQHSLRNPIVEQVITETLRVVKDIWLEFGNGKEKFFDEIHIELGREMKNNAADRKSISESNTRNENTNLRIRAMLSEFSNPEYNIENVRPYSPSQMEILKIYEDGILNSDIDIPEEIQKISKVPKPSNKEILKYKLWLEQKYKSPYTGKIIPLNKLFTPAYEIEHIIPQSIYFDDSFSNKVICESEVNKLKGNQFGYSFIKKHHTEKVTLNRGGIVEILSPEQYEELIKSDYSKNKSKFKKLLLEEIPGKMIERQLNDTRYISKMIKNLLSHLVRNEKDDDGVTSKNVLSSNGNITNVLKQDWGMNDVWNEIVTPRFERLNKLTNSNQFGEWLTKDGSKVFQTHVPIEFQRNFNKKRIDHRHHALDALIIACASRNHINYLNNQSASNNSNFKENRIDLKMLLCYKTKPDSNGNYKWMFKKPWETITQDTRLELGRTLVSFKKNLRIINKTVNYYQKFFENEKQFIKQTKGENWAIRKPLHKETVSGLVKLKYNSDKFISLNNAIENYSLIIDPSIKNIIKNVLIKNKNDFNATKKHFREFPIIINENHIIKVQVYEWKEGTANRIMLDDSFNSEKIKSVTDSGIQKILINHLSKFKETLGTKVIEHPELAFSPEGIEEMNKNIISLNDNKFHQPIYKVRKFEEGSKFPVGPTGNKKDKYVESAKGTNLYFAIYKNKEGKRSYDTIPLNIVIERLKQGLVPVPEKESHELLFWLSPNDLVYIPREEGINTSLIFEANGRLTEDQLNHTYKMMSSSSIDCFFIKNEVASVIVDKLEFTTSNKMQKSIEGIMIKEKCWKLEVNRIGKVIRVLK